MIKVKRIIPIVIALVVLLGSVVFAGFENNKQQRGIDMPSFSVNGSTVTCMASARYFGKSIDATLELYQGSTFVTSWHKTGTGSVSFAEQTGFTSGLSYTLTISGTVNGIAFTPQSTTQTLW